MAQNHDHLVCRAHATFEHLSPQFVLTPHGVFRLANPRAVMPGRCHMVAYHPFDQFACVVAISIHPDRGATA